jgi:hypothetical protein
VTKPRPFPFDFGCNRIPNGAEIGLAGLERRCDCAYVFRNFTQGMYDGEQSSCGIASALVETRKSLSGLLITLDELFDGSSQLGGRVLLIHERIADSGNRGLHLLERGRCFAPRSGR